MVYDQVRHDFDISTQSAYVSPCAKSGIDLGVVYWVKPCIRPVDRKEERQQVNSSEDSFQGATQKRIQLSQGSASKPVHIRNQLNLVFHAKGIFATERVPELGSTLLWVLESKRRRVEKTRLLGVRILECVADGHRGRATRNRARGNHVTGCPGASGVNFSNANRVRDVVHAQRYGQSFCELIAPK